MIDINTIVIGMLLIAGISTIIGGYFICLDYHKLVVAMIEQENRLNVVLRSSKQNG